MSQSNPIPILLIDGWEYKPDGYARSADPVFGGLFDIGSAARLVAEIPESLATWLEQRVSAVTLNNRFVIRRISAYDAEDDRAEWTRQRLELAATVAPLVVVFDFANRSHSPLLIVAGPNVPSMANVSPCDAARWEATLQFLAGDASEADRSIFVDDGEDFVFNANPELIDRLQQLYGG